MKLETAQKIASLLPGNWIANPHPYNPESMELTRSDGLTLWVSGPGWNRKPDMETISFNMPRMDEFGNLGRNAPPVPVHIGGKPAVAPTMNVSASKTPDQIARSIASRILEDSGEIYALAMETARKTREFHAIKNLGMSEMQEIVQGEKHGESLHLYGPGESRLRFEVSTHNGTSFSFKLENLPKNEALHIASLLKNTLF